MASTVTFTITKKDIHGTQRVHYVDMDVTSYDQTTDVEITAADFGLARIEDIVVQSEESPTIYGVWNGLTAAGSASIELRSVAGTEAFAAADHGVLRVIARGK